MSFNFFKRVTKQFGKKIAAELFNEKPWLIELLICQDEIETTTPHTHYKNAYRKAEPFYWNKIADWIYEDSKSFNFSYVLDIGCAYGTLSLFVNNLFKCHSHCIDFTDIFFGTPLSNSHEIDFKVCNIELDDPIWPIKYDAIIFTEVLEHFNFNPIPTLEKIKHLLAPKGRLYISTPDAKAWGKLPKYKTFHDIPYPEHGLPIIDDHIYQYTKKELLELAEIVGFKVERIDYSFGDPHRHINAILTTE
jgi:SAM-dependent methyltransferase